MKEKGANEIVFKAMGRAINKTVMIVELIKVWVFYECGSSCSPSICDISPYLYTIIVCFIPNVVILIPELKKTRS
jgi:Alba